MIAHLNIEAGSNQLPVIIEEISKRLRDNSENVQSMAVDIWLMLRYKVQLATGTSRDQLDVALADVHKTIAMLLKSSTEAIYASIIQTLSSLVTTETSVHKTGAATPIEEFKQELEVATGAILKILNKGTDQRRIVMLQTVSNLIKTGTRLHLTPYTT